MIANTEIKPSLFTPRWWLELLFSLILVEVVIGGGGHFFEIGPLTLRMVLYFIAVPISLFYANYKQDIAKYVFYLLAIFTVLTVVASVIGGLNGAKKELVFEDVKIVMYFYMLLFFSIVIKGHRMIERVIFIIKYSSLFLTIAYLIVFLLIALGYVNFLKFYNFIYPIGEIAFRGSGGFFIYKGFIYLCIGFVFWALESSFYSKMIALLMFLAIISTFTRGFLLSTVAVYVLYQIFMNKNKLVSFGVLLFVIVVISIALPLYINTLGDRTDSDMTRIIQIQQVKDRTDFVNTLVGNGFGIGVPIRETHFEIGYLETFAKQGIVGLMFWIGLFIYIVVLFFNIMAAKKYIKSATPFLLGVILIYVQSFTNPYLTNAIGLGFVLATIVIFNAMIEMDKEILNTD